MKTCTLCAETKEDDNFYWKVRNIIRFARCKKCFNAAESKRRKCKTSMTYRKRKYDKKRSQARERRIEFNLSFDEFESVRSGNICSYCKRKITTHKTIDRVDAMQGYHLGNVVLACQLCNSRKSTFSKKDIPFLKAILLELKKAV